MLFCGEVAGKDGHKSHRRSACEVHCQETDVGGLPPVGQGARQVFFGLHLAKEDLTRCDRAGLAKHFSLIIIIEIGCSVALPNSAQTEADGALRGRYCYPTLGEVTAFGSKF